MRNRFASFAFVIVTVQLGWVASGNADVIRLRSGGQLRGELLESAESQSFADAQSLPSADDSTDSDPSESAFEEEAPETVRIRLLSGAIVAVDRGQIDFVEERPLIYEDYVSRARRAEGSIESHWQLAEWCRVRRLTDERNEQLESILELDPDHRDARRILGYVEHNGEWMTKDEVMTSRGYVRHQNRWVTTQELALIEKNQDQREAEIAWYPRVRAWLGWITASNQQRKRKGLAEFRDVTDADAIPALKKFMSDHQNVAVRRLYIDVLNGLGGTGPVLPLLEQYLYDVNDVLREHAFTSLTADQYEAALPLLITALTNDGNLVVNRAAEALGRIGDERAVPALINALVTTHRYKVTVNTSNPVSFARGPNGQVGMYNQSQPGALAGVNLEAMQRLGQLPYGAQVIRSNPPITRTKTVTMKSDFKNPGVLAALESLTDKKFGYNEYDWQLWWSVYKS